MQLQQTERMFEKDMLKYSHPGRRSCRAYGTSSKFSAAVCALRSSASSRTRATTVAVSTHTVTVTFSVPLPHTQLCKQTHHYDVRASNDDHIRVPDEGVVRLGAYGLGEQERGGDGDKDRGQEDEEDIDDVRDGRPPGRSGEHAGRVQESPPPRRLSLARLCRELPERHEAFNRLAG